MATKDFSGVEVLQAYTGRLLCDLAKMYELLSHAVGEDISGCQIPRVSHEVKPWLGRWFPEIAAAGSEGNLCVLDSTLAKAVDDADRGRRLDDWLKGCVRFYGLRSSYAVPQIPMDDHNQIDPLVELERAEEAPIVVLPPER